MKTAPAFSSAYKDRRWLVAANVLYDWKANGETKQTYAIAKRNREIFALAGLWENWKERSSNEWILAFTVLTTKHNEVVAALHDGMPVILQPRQSALSIRAEAQTLAEARLAQKAAASYLRLTRSLEITHNQI